jgi:hypothetical protein
MHSLAILLEIAPQRQHNQKQSGENRMIFGFSGLRKPTIALVEWDKGTGLVSHSRGRKRGCNGTKALYEHVIPAKAGI